MTVRNLPERPSLDQLKRQAKELLHAMRKGDVDARARFRALPAFAAMSVDAFERHRLALHDAQSVLAREHGFASWNDLRDHVEELTLALDGATEAFVNAATGDRVDRAERLLARHPSIPGRSPFAAIVLGDAAAVERRLTAAPAVATERGGPRDWQPLHYLCHSALVRKAADREAGAVAIARRLLALGADPNLRYTWEHHGVYRPVLWAALCKARSLPLAAALLEAGANPDDGVTLPLVAGGGDVAALDLLLAHGANVDCPAVTDGAAPLYAILQWADTIDGARWLLAHGANPDPVCAANGETPLHLAAAGRDVALTEDLVARGAAVNRPRADGRAPYVIAALNGNRRVADWLLAHGASPEVTPIDRLVAACSIDDRSSAEALLRDQPHLRDQIAPIHYAAFLRAVERNEIPVLSTMLACGFDPNRPDESIGKTALHVAAAEGWPEAVRALLAGGASVDVRDREFHGTPLVWAADGARTRPAGRDHAAVAKLLLDAGSPVDWAGGGEPAEVIGETIAAWRGLDDVTT